MIDCRYYRSKIKKIFYRWIDNIDENETKSIDRYYRYRSIDPSPIVPIYGHEHAAGTCCMSMTNARAACPCRMLMPYVICPCRMLMPHDHAACPCRTSMSPVHAACYAGRPSGMDLLNVHAAWSCRMSLLHASAACPRCKVGNQFQEQRGGCGGKGQQKV